MERETATEHYTGWPKIMFTAITVTTDITVNLLLGPPVYMGTGGNEFSGSELSCTFVTRPL